MLQLPGLRYLRVYKKIFNRTVRKILIPTILVQRDHFVLHTKVVFVDTCYRQRWARKWPPWRRSRTPRFLWSDKLPGTRRIDLLATFVVDSPRLWLSVSRSVGLWIWQTCRHYCPGREVKRLLQRDLYSFSINSTTRSVRFIKFFHFAF